MKKITIALLLLIGGNAICQKTITTSDYSEIEISGGFTVTLVPGKEGKIEVSGPDKAVEATVVECNGGKLEIHSKGLAKSSSVRITIPVTEITSIGLSGSGSVDSEGFLRSKSFQARLSGSGHIKLKVNADSVDALASGSGNITIAGATSDFKCSLSGSGGISAKELKSKNVTALVSGSGNCHVNVDGSLKAQIAGSGNVRYSGKADVVEQNIIGSGSLTKA